MIKEEVSLLVQYQINRSLRLLIGIALLVTTSIPGCASRLQEITFEPGIERYPAPQNLSERLDEPLTELPLYNPASRSLPDLRSYDLTLLDLSEHRDALLHSGFNTKTKWPHTLPTEFDPANILEVNKNPGLMLRTLHEQGITGEGVGVAVIDYTLLVNHIEYQDKLAMYREVNLHLDPAEFHGAAMLSILAGESTGVAPGVTVYYVAVRNMDFEKNDIIQNQKYTAQAIHGLIGLNKRLADEDKIRVISLSQWWSPQTKGYKEMRDAVTAARDAGIFVVSCNLWQYDERFHIHGLVKDALADPDDYAAYRPASWEHWITAVNRNGHGDYYRNEFNQIDPSLVLLIPSAGVVSAGSEDSEDYIFTAEVNWSSTIPYVAGLYALACQVNPDIDPEEFWQAAYQSGTPCELERDGTQAEGRIVNPIKLLELVTQ